MRAGESRLRSVAGTKRLRAAPGPALRHMFVPGSNLLFVGGLFVVGWFSGKFGWNRNEEGYLKSARERIAAKEAELASAPPDRVAAELAAANEAELAAAHKKDD